MYCAGDIMLDGLCMSNVETCVAQLIGGSDARLYRGSLRYVLVRKEWYYDVIIADILVGGASLSMDCKEVW